MYIVPERYGCPKCGQEADYGPHDPFSAPILSEGPVCPKCYADFLREHCGVMRPLRAATREPEKLPGAIIQNSYK